ncbi:MAG: hypothetical protein H7Y01_15225, partial [Ferruginibacter sp.]|nr:hypothetical protein [Chitinophagaceae bacterium]
ALDMQQVKEDLAKLTPLLQDAALDMQQVKEDLAKLTPLSPDELKALLPEELMGTSRSGADVNANIGASVASADYKINDSTSLQLSIVDCAGPGGAGIYAIQYLGMFNVQEEDEEEYTKTIDINGGKAFENCRKTRKSCTLTFFSENRFLVSLEGDNMEIDVLKDLAKGLKLK